MDSALIAPEEVDCGLIYCDDTWNCRGEFPSQSVAELADDIQKRGLENPIDLQPACDVPGGLATGYGFRIVCGHRRFTAWTVFLGREKIAARIHHGLSELDARIKNLKENDERENLNPLQEAFALRDIVKNYPTGTSDAAIYRDLKKSARWFRGRMDLLALPEEVQQMIAARRIAIHEIEIIQRGDSPDKQLEIANRLILAKRGRGKKRFVKDESLYRTFRRVRGKDEINAMIGQILENGLEHSLSAARVLAWAACSVSDEEISHDISKILASETAI